MKNYLLSSVANVVLIAVVSSGIAQAQNVAAPAQVPVFPTAPPPPYVTPEIPQGSGPYPAIMESDPGLKTHTVYRPNNLTALGKQKLPIVVWGNGACLNVGNRFRYFLTELASYGYLAVATGPIREKEVEGTIGAGAAPAPTAGAPAMAPAPTPPQRKAPDTTASQLIDAMNWAIAENTRPGSPYFGKLDTTKIAVMGQSCGGLQALDAVHDPRVATLGVWNSGTLPNAEATKTMAGADASKERLKTLHVPAIYVSGEPSDIAYPNAEDDYARIEGIPLFRAWREKTGHTGTYREPNGGAFGKVGVAWLQWQLKGDPVAAKMFVGADCGLCTNPEWHVKKKNIE